MRLILYTTQRERNEKQSVRRIRSHSEVKTEGNYVNRCAVGSCSHLMFRWFGEGAPAAIIGDRPRFYLS